jgi:hypothetical protein
MKLGNGWERKLRRGSASLGLCILVLVVVLLLNVGMTALCTSQFWFIDLTPKSKYTVYQQNRNLQKECGMYTLMDETVGYLEYIFDQANQKREEPVKVEIIFCSEPDQLIKTDSMRYVYYTALSLQKQFPDIIQVSWRDVWSNPSSVDMYRSTSYSTIFPSNVIVASGTEFRISSARSFYTYDSESAADVPIGYNGQKQFVKQILDVTGAEAPICCLTINHGEPFANWDLNDRANWPEYSEFMKVIEGAGYEIQFINLETDEIPENCRLILTFDPQTDFVSAFGNENVTVSETKKLDAHLDKSYSFMVFMDADTPHLPNLEEYLTFWGIEYKRANGQNAADETVKGNYVISDSQNKLDGTGNTFVAQYPVGKGIGAASLSDIIAAGTEPKVVFGNAIGVAFSSTYDRGYVMADEKNNLPAYTYAHASRDGWNRMIFDVFRTGTDANYSVMAGGVQLKDKNGVPMGGSEQFNVMTISAEPRTTGEGMGYTTVNQPSFVCAVGSTEFATDALLGSTSYGNTDALLSVLRYVGKEVNPVGLSFLELYDSQIDTKQHMQTNSATGVTTINPGIITATVVLTVLPALTMTIAGVVVLVRRKTRQASKV